MRVLTRPQLIDRLRNYLLGLVDDEHSMCSVAASRDIFCRGFRRLTDEELRQRYDWIVKTRPKISREKLEDLANRFQIGRTEALGAELTCDAQFRAGDTCMGWAEFPNEELVRYHKEWLGEEVVVLED
jgi:hypothetical protein